MVVGERWMVVAGVGCGVSCVVNDVGGCGDGCVGACMAVISICESFCVWISVCGTSSLRQRRFVTCTSSLTPARTSTVRT